MISANFSVCIDACVLANHSVCDLLLRLAEEPRLYTPIFSREILAEANRVHVTKLDWRQELANYFDTEITRQFPTSIIEGYEPIMAGLTNDEGDRHVLAAAIKGGAQLILTFNLKHFRDEHLSPWDIRASHPQDYLLVLYELRPEIVIAKLYDIANQKQERVQDRLSKLSKTLPRFTGRVAEDQNWSIQRPTL